MKSIKLTASEAQLVAFTLKRDNVPFQKERHEDVKRNRVSFIITCKNLSSNVKHYFTK